jgi:phage terminase large subunit-like protein
MNVSLSKAAADVALLGATVRWWPKPQELLASLEGPERVHVWSIGRQAGKSSLAACAAVHNAALRDDLDGIVPKGRTRYLLVAAPGEDQAREFVRLCDALIDASPLLRRMATVKADEIRFRKPNGAKIAIRAMAANSRTARGRSASLIVLDEFAHFTDTAGPASDEEIQGARTVHPRVW